MEDSCDQVLQPSRQGAPRVYQRIHIGRQQDKHGLRQELQHSKDAGNPELLPSLMNI